MTCLKAPNFPWPRSDDCKMNRPTAVRISPEIWNLRVRMNWITASPVPFWAEIHTLFKISFPWNRKLLFSWRQIRFGPKHRGCSSPAAVYNRTVLDLKAGLQFNKQVYIGPEYTGRLSNVTYSHLTFNSAYLWIATRTYRCSQWWKKS